MLEQEAASRGVELRIERTRRAGHAIELARADRTNVDLIIAVGGDGTVSDVVTGLDGSGALVAIVPTGSTNMIARDLGIPRSLKEAIAVAMGDGVPTAIDVARAGSTTFMHMAGAGFDAAIMRDTSSRWKRRIGWVAYLVPAVRHLRFPAFNASLNIDGRVVTVRARVILFAISGSIIHPRFSVGAGIDTTDGVIDVCVYNPLGVRGALSSAWWIARGTPERSPWLIQYRGRSITLNADRPVPFEVDGDPVGELPIDIEILPARALVLAPASR